MERFEEHPAGEVRNFTLMSGFGFENEVLDFSISSLQSSEPSATSTVDIRLSKSRANALSSLINEEDLTKQSENLISLLRQNDTLGQEVTEENNLIKYLKQCSIDGSPHGESTEQSGNVWSRGQSTTVDLIEDTSISGKSDLLSFSDASYLKFPAVEDGDVCKALSAHFNADPPSAMGSVCDEGEIDVWNEEGESESISNRQKPPEEESVLLIDLRSVDGGSSLHEEPIDPQSNVTSGCPKTAAWMSDYDTEAENIRQDKIWSTGCDVQLIPTPHGGDSEYGGQSDFDEADFEPFNHSAMSQAEKSALARNPFVAADQNCDFTQSPYDDRQDAFKDLDGGSNGSCSQNDVSLKHTYFKTRSYRSRDLLASDFNEPMSSFLGFDRDKYESPPKPVADVSAETERSKPLSCFEDDFSSSSSDDESTDDNQSLLGVNPSQFTPSSGKAECSALSAEQNSVLPLTTRSYSPKLITAAPSEFTVMENAEEETNSSDEDLLLLLRNLMKESSKTGNPDKFVRENFLSHFKKYDSLITSRPPFDDSKIVDVQTDSIVGEDSLSLTLNSTTSKEIYELQRLQEELHGHPRRRPPFTSPGERKVREKDLRRDRISPERKRAELPLELEKLGADLTSVISIGPLSASATIDFGSVPEMCQLEKTVTLTNASSFAMSLVVRLIVPPESRGLFELSSDGCDPGRVVGSSAAASIKMRPESSRNIVLRFIAPNFQSLKRGADDLVKLHAEIEVLLNCGEENNFLVTSAVVEARVAEIALRTLSKVPITMNSERGRPEASTLRLRNRSLIPLCISTKVSNQGFFSVSPNSVSLEPQGNCDLTIQFSTVGDVSVPSKISGELSITVEPKGMETVLPVVVLCSSPSTHLGDREIIRDESASIKEGPETPHCSSKFPAMSTRTVRGCQPVPLTSLPSAEGALFERSSYACDSAVLPQRDSSSFPPLGSVLPSPSLSAPQILPPRSLVAPTAPAGAVGRTLAEEELITKDTMKMPPTIKSEKMSLFINKKTIIFGAVEEGRVSIKSIQLQNKGRSRSITLNMAVKGVRGMRNSTSFYFLDDQGEAGGRKMTFKEVVLEPGEQRTIDVCFKPTHVAPFSAQIICKPQRINDKPVKFVIPLSGFGGRGRVCVNENASTEGCPSDATSDESVEFLPFRRMSSVEGAPLLAHASLRNIGSRSVCAKLSILTDEESGCTFSASEVSVQPWELVLMPGEVKNIAILSSNHTLGRISNPVAVLRVVYASEVLRRRLRRLPDAHSAWLMSCNRKWRSIDFTRSVPDEELLSHHEEADPFPGDSAEDGPAFCNDCQSVSVPLMVEDSQSNSASKSCDVSMVAIDSYCDTMTSFFNASFLNSPPRKLSTVAATGGRSESSVPKPKCCGFDVFPSVLDMTSSQIAPRMVTVISNSDSEEILEVFCDVEWLIVDPRELSLPPKRSSTLRIDIDRSKLAGKFPANPTTELNVLGKNDSKAITVLLKVDDADRTRTKGRSCLATEAAVDRLCATRGPLGGDLGDKRQLKGCDSENESYGAKSSLQQQRSESFGAKSGWSGRREPNHSTTDDCNNEETAALRAQNRCSKKGVVFAPSVVFPSTVVNQRSVVKLNVQNFDDVTHHVMVAMDPKDDGCSSFEVRHKDFKISPRHSVYLPLVFRPSTSGSHQLTLRIRVTSREDPLELSLKGSAVAAH